MNNQIIRNQLQHKARELLTEFQRCNKTAKSALTALAATIECYLEIRKALAPYIGTDGYMQELAGITFQIGASIKALDNPPAQSSEQPKIDSGNSYFSVTVRAESMDELGTGSLICDAFVLVQAPTPQAASKAAVAWHTDHPVVHADDLEPLSQSPIQHCDMTGHTAWEKSRAIRYSSIRVLPLSPDEVSDFKSMTTGLTNAHCVIA
jgi:hypothetical protein